MGHMKAFAYECEMDGADPTATLRAMGAYQEQPMNDYRLTCRRVSTGTVVASKIVRGVSQQTALARADAWPGAVAAARGIDAADLVVRVERLAGERTLPVSVGAF